MPTITNVRIMRFRKVQPEKFGGAGAEVELNATIHDGEDYRDVTRGLLFDARAMCYENLGMRLPKEAFDSEAELSDLERLAEEAGKEGAKAVADNEAEIPGEEKSADKKRGRPAGSKNTRPKAGSKAAKAAEEAALVKAAAAALEAEMAEADQAAVPGEDEIPGEEAPKDQISTGEERVDPDDTIPGEEESGDPVDNLPDAGGEKAEADEELDGVGFNSYINDSIRSSKLSGLQAKQMMKDMGVARVRDLNTAEKLAQAKMLIDAFIDSNEKKKK